VGASRLDKDRFRKSGSIQERALVLNETPP